MFRTAGFASAALGCIGLPALIAGLDIDSAAAVGELERLRAAHAGEPGSELARQFLLAGVWPFPGEWPVAVAAAERLLATARLMQIAGLFAIAGLTYFAMLLARGRLAALASAAALAVLPVVHDVGHVLRPETAGVMFTMLGLLLLQSLTTVLHGGRSRGRVRRAIVLVLFAGAAGFAFGMGIGTVPSLGGTLLIGIALFMLTTLQLALRGLGVGRRRGMMAWPAFAITGRLWPMAAVALAGPVGAIFLMLWSLELPVDELLPTRLAAAVLPQQPLAFCVVLVLLAIGALVLLLRTGIRFGRRGRVTPEVVLLAYVATQTLGLATFAPGRDSLPAAPALAMLVGEAVVALAAFVPWLVRRRGA
ncbi:MAG: hypothetical protein NXI31_24670 [bacterium]|nr:hypothetical protein [bacterium]